MKFIITIFLSLFIYSYFATVHADTLFDTFADTWVIDSPVSDITQDELSSIDESIVEPETLSSASVEQINYEGITYTPWELIHRIPMLAGFTWIGEVSNFITPQMFLWTPFGPNPNYQWQINPYISEFKSKSTTYKECVTNESYLSYGLGDRIKENDIEEFKAIAKICAQTFYGSYFDKKTYTSREEFLMMMFTLFDEDVTFDGEFTDNGEYIPWTEVTSGFSNIDDTSWYAPYLGRANDIGILSIDETNWEIEKGISNAEAISYLSLYTAYRMEFQWDNVDRGSITTEKIKFNMTFINDEEIAIRAQ